MPLLDEFDQAIVRNALNFNGQHRMPVCAFYATSESNSRKERVEQFIPVDRLAAQSDDPDQVGWNLISVEGREPTEKELAEYEHRGGQLYPYSEFVDLINFDELRAVERTADSLILESIPTESFLERENAEYLNEHLHMQLVIDLKRQRLDYLKVGLSDAFKPNPFVKIHDFNQHLEFEYQPEIGEVVLTEMRMLGDVKFVVVRRKFFLNAKLYDFSCPLALQPENCVELSSSGQDSVADQDT